MSPKPDDKSRAAAEFAWRHYEVDPSISKVVRYLATPEAEANLSEPIKLLVVNELALETGVVSLDFSAVPRTGIDFPSLVVELSPDKLDGLGQDGLRLPPDWLHAQELPRQPSP